MRRPLARLRDDVKVRLTRSPRLYGALRRPYAVSRYALKKPHDPDYEVFKLVGARGGDFLDVGANAGMSALSFRIFNKSSPIVSVEPNPFHRDDLRFVSRFVKPFRYMIVGAGSASGTMTLYVPVYRGVPLTTEASLTEAEVTGSGSLRARLGSRMDGPDFRISRQDVSVICLDELSLAPAYVKLDVQGAEYESLLGLERTLRKHRPVLLIETPDEAVRAFLDGLGYVARVYDRTERRLAPDTGGHTNSVFLHSEDRALDHL